MNALRRSLAILAGPARFGAVAAGCAVTAACVGSPFRSAQIDPSSPVAPEVAQKVRAKAAFPRFRDIPTKSADLRPIGVYGEQARILKVAGQELIRDTEPGTWTLSDTESFANRARGEAGPELPPAQPGTPEDVAKSLRERATPPPPRR